MSWKEDICGPLNSVYGKKQKAMKYTDSKNKEHEISTMSTNHLANAIRKNGDEISRYNSALLKAMKAELALRPDAVLPADQVPKVKLPDINTCVDPDYDHKIGFIGNTPVQGVIDNTSGQDAMSDDF